MLNTTHVAARGRDRSTDCLPPVDPGNGLGGTRSVVRWATVLFCVVGVLRDASDAKAPNDGNI